VAERVFLTRSAEETVLRGRKIGQTITPPVLILLSGDLGTGKTTLTKGIVSGIGAAHEDEVTSPTFTLVHKYERDARVYHVDLYRIESDQDFRTLGLEEVFDEPAVVIIEWADKLTLATGWPVLRINLEHVSDRERRISIEDPADRLAPAFTNP
jgi:tRNA threonylcarbamoyladenosine biosynthesis protein TsaE